VISLSVHQPLVFSLFSEVDGVSWVEDEAERLVEL
jgi:hypothetical protein